MTQSYNLTYNTANGKYEEEVFAIGHCAAVKYQEVQTEAYKRKHAGNTDVKIVMMDNDKALWEEVM
jgi:hypothetical protein